MAKKNGLSERQQNILRHIYTSITQEGRPPTIRELCTAANISSTSVANYNLDKLETEEYVSRDAEVSRGLRLTEKAMAWLGMMGEIVEETVVPAFAAAQNAVSRFITIPYAGTIAAGKPILTNPDAYTTDNEFESSSTLLPPYTKYMYVRRVTCAACFEELSNE